MTAMIAGLGFCLVILPFLSTNAFGALTDKIISGTVCNQNSQPISGADVTVEIWSGFWPERVSLRITEATVTNAYGYYEVTIDANYWDPHNTIIVNVTYGAAQETRIVEADADPYQTIDVTLVTGIPELSGPLSVLAALTGCVLPIAISRARRRS